MNKEEAKARIEAAEKELAAAKAALEQAQELDGRVIMKPSEVPVGEYFRFVDKEYDIGRLQARMSDWHYASFGSPMCPRNIQRCHDKPVYLTDPYGNAIEPCEELPSLFRIGDAIAALGPSPSSLSTAFIWDETKEGGAYWHEQKDSYELSAHAAAKLRGMIHKWNQENGNQG